MPSEKRARQRARREEKVAVVERHARRSRVARRVIAVALVAGLIIALIALLSSGGGKPKKSASSTTTTAASTSTSATSTTLAAAGPTCPPATGASKRTIRFTKAPPLCVSRTGVYDAQVRTDVGTFVIRMRAASSLAAVNNFVFLARYRYYDGITFHRVIPGFVVQGGDPTGTGTGGPGYEFTGNTPPASCNATKHCYPLGAVAMANTGVPSTNGSQFFIVVGASGEALPNKYTLFGQVISGMNVVQKIAADGNASNGGTPPKVLHKMLRVTISQVAA